MAQDPGEASDDASDVDPRELRAAVESCIRDYPEASSERVDQLLRAFLAQSHDAKVQKYRVLFAERDTRVQLRRDRVWGGGTGTQPRSS